MTKSPIAPSRTARTVTVATELPADAALVWRAVRTPAAFVYVAGRMLRYPAAECTDRPWRVGDEIAGWTFLFGFLPLSHHRLRVEALRDEARELQSDEGGGLVRSWRHLIRVTPLGPGRCRYVDSVEIDAGPFTPAVAGFAHVFYRYRQRRWRTLACLLGRISDVQRDESGERW